jgi:hypothetical protein
VAQSIHVYRLEAPKNRSLAALSRDLTIAGEENDSAKAEENNCVKAEENYCAKAEENNCAKY